MFGSDILMIDQEALTTAKRGYALQAQQMRELRQKLIDSVALLEDSWDSDAGVQFVSKFNTDLKKNMKLYAEVVDHMAQNMDIAVNRYQEVFDEAEQLKLNL